MKKHANGGEDQNNGDTVDLCVSTENAMQEKNNVNVKSIVKSFLNLPCDVLTIGQRCANSFIMRQYRVTGTNAGKYSCQVISFECIVVYRELDRSQHCKSGHPYLYVSF